MECKEIVNVSTCAVCGWPVTGDAVADVCLEHGETVIYHHHCFDKMPPWESGCGGCKVIGR